MRLMGLIESNGSFVVNVIKNNKYSCGYGVGINFTFRSNESDLLEYVQKLLSEIHIESSKKDNTLIIKGEEYLHMFCKHIDNNGNFISIKRQEEFLMFKKILYLYMHREHLTIEGIEKIKNIKENK